MDRVERHHWWFVGRRLIIKSFLEAIFKEQKPPVKILDVGCGTGANLELLSEFGDSEGVDVSAEALSFCEQRGLRQVKLGAAEELPYADQSFELVTALDVVEHLDDDVAGLKEMRRVLRPGGRALLFVPAFMFLWGVQDDISNHRRRYTKEGLRSAVEHAGFAIERLTYVNITFFGPILLGRVLMRITGWKPASENNLTVGSLNGVLGKIFGFERFVLKQTNLPLGVSLVCVARRIEA